MNKDLSISLEVSDYDVINLFSYEPFGEYANVWTWDRDMRTDEAIDKNIYKVLSKLYNPKSK